MPVAGTKTSLKVIDNKVSLLYLFDRPRTEKQHRDRVILHCLVNLDCLKTRLTSLRWSNCVTLPNGKQGIYVKKSENLWEVLIPTDQRLFKLVEDYHSQFGIKSDHFLLTIPNRFKKDRSPMSLRQLHRIIQEWPLKLPK